MRRHEYEAFTGRLAKAFLGFPAGLFSQAGIGPCRRGCVVRCQPAGLSELESIRPADAGQHDRGSPRQSSTDRPARHDLQLRTRRVSRAARDLAELRWDDVALLSRTSCSINFLPLFSPRPSTSGPDSNAGAFFRAATAADAREDCNQTFIGPPNEIYEARDTVGFRSPAVG